MTTQTINPTALHLALRRKAPAVRRPLRLPWPQRLCKAVATAFQRPIPHARREHTIRLGPRETVISNPAKIKVGATLRAVPFVA